MRINFFSVLERGEIVMYLRKYGKSANLCLASTVIFTFLLQASNEKMNKKERRIAILILVIYHKIVIDLSTSGLDNVNIFTTNRLANLHAGFKIAELFSNNLAGVDTQTIAKLLSQVRMGRTWNQMSIYF